MNILDEIIANKKMEVEINKVLFPKEQLVHSKYYNRVIYSIKSTLQSRTGIIAEFKRKSPSKGVIRPDANAVDITLTYQKNGAAACSILTDQTFFNGSESDLSSARDHLTIPILRKDFIIDRYQIMQAKSIGADFILLIAECLTKNEISDFSKEAKDLGLEVLMELHSESELDKWNPLIDLIGVNNRNLKNFATGINTSLELVSKLPSESIWITESGLHHDADIILLESKGYKGFLIGETFMKAASPGDLCKRFVELLNQQTNVN